MAKPIYLIRVRAYPKPAPFVSVWLIRRDGAASSGRVFGEMSPDSAQEIIDALALPVEREDSPIEPGDPKPIPKKQLPRKSPTTPASEASQPLLF